MLRIEFQTDPGEISSEFFNLDTRVENLEIDNVLPVADDSGVFSLTVEFDTNVSEEFLSDQLSDIRILDMSEAATNSHTYYLSVLTDVSTASILLLLTRNEAIPHRIVGQRSHLDVIASVRDWNHLKQVAETIENEHGSLELVGTTQTEGIGFPLGGNKIKRCVSGKLTDKQLKVLETAYRLGYFKIPQEVTAEEISKELDISRSTLSERLRRVEHNLCSLLFGPRT